MMESLPIDSIGIGKAETDDDATAIALQIALGTLRQFKPNDRSEKDRRYAVTITEMEKVYAYFVTWVTGQEKM